MNKVPYSDHQHISSKTDLLSFQKLVIEGVSIRTYPIYGTPINEEEAPLVIFQKNGDKMKLKFNYFITKNGIVKIYNQNGELRKGYKNTDVRIRCVLDNGTPLKRQRAMIMLWSFYPHLDWTKSLNATDSTVDHITGTHENEHFGTLECVPNKENIKRAVLHSKSAAQKSGSSRSKPFNVYKNGVLCFECKNRLDTKAKFKEHENIDCGVTNPGYYIKNNKTYKKIYTFQYIEREPELLEDEEWRPESQWCQKDELLKLAKTPTEISSKGRIKDAYGIISRGKDENGNNNKKGRYYSGINVAKVVHYAFSNRVLKKDDIILHNDGVIMTDGVMLNDGSGRYSNALGTFRIGNHKQNMEDMSATRKREASLDPANEFIVKKDGENIGNYFYIPNCAEELVKAYGGKESSYRSGICRCLKGERPYLSKKLNLECAYKIQR